MHKLSKYKIVLIRIIILLFIFSISRMFMLIFNLSSFNINFFEALKIWFFGLRFDLSGLLMLNGLFILFYILPFRFTENKKYVKTIDIISLSFNSIAILINLADTIYYRFTLRRTTFEIFKMFEANDGFIELIPSFIIDFWFVPFIVIILSILLIKLYLPFIKALKVTRYTLKTYILQSIAFFLIAGFIILGIRGGLQLIPISLVDAAIYTTPDKTPILLNTTFTIFKTIETGSIERLNYFNEKELADIYTPEHFYNKTDSFETKNMNVVLIILESFSVEHFRYFNKNIENGKYLGFTPFLDSLFKESLVFKAVANGKRSIDGIPAIVSALPNLMDNAFIVSTYAGNKINSLAQVLKENSYNTTFFHGGKNGTMNFNSYSKQAGFDKYFGKNEYNNNNDYDGTWGIWDEFFFKYFLYKISEIKEPFFTTFFSLSSHHPYGIPKKYKNKFRKGKLPIQETVMYTDYCLKQFFKAAQKEKWYNNTLFVIVADHTSEGSLEFYKNSVGQFQIPIAFYAPTDSTLKFRKVRKIAQQCDVFPSVIDYLNIKSSFVAFGNSVFDTLAPNFGINYTRGYVQLIKDNYLIKFSGNKTKEFYNLKVDSLLKNNLADTNIQIKKDMERFLKANVQQFNNRMIENRLTIKTKNK